MFMAMNMLYMCYVFRGYFKVHEFSINLNLTDDYNEYRNKILRSLSEYLVKPNENLDIDEFVEFRKPVSSMVDGVQVNINKIKLSNQ